MPRFLRKARPAVSTGFLCTLALATAPSGAATDDGFRIMSEQEADAHRQVMASMDDAAREAYRNAQYAQLRQRAAENGFSLPETPPWSEQAADDNLQAEFVARHEAMRARLDAHRAARQPPAEPATDLVVATETVITPVDEPATAATAEETRPVASADATVATATGTISSPPITPAAAMPALQPAAAEEPLADRAGDTTAEPRPVTSARPAPPTPPVMPTPPRAPASPAQGTARTTADEPGAGATDTTAAYRKQMRTRFDDYLKERQAQQDENLRLQREQHEAQMQNRTWFQSGPRIPPYPYPSARNYPPRYPSAPPAYRSPYWQPQR
ncbi:MAG: hypothetical protein KDI88_14300 [Gammaproteobacteria bacterium]|nr:hypothetical protein [Gammaproteobacteria bacterium]